MYSDFTLLFQQAGPFSERFPVSTMVNLQPTENASSLLNTECFQISYCLFQDSVFDLIVGLKHTETNVMTREGLSLISSTPLSLLCIHSFHIWDFCNDDYHPPTDKHQPMRHETPNGLCHKNTYHHNSAQIPTFAVKVMLIFKKSNWILQTVQDPFFVSWLINVFKFNMVSFLTAFETWTLTVFYTFRDFVQIK